MKNVEVKRSKVHGRGLFATADIAWGTKIIEYMGKVITDLEAERRLKRGAAFIFELAPDKNIDGADGGNEARFANHGRENANCFVLREKGRIWIVAGIEGIKKGQEILFDYGSDCFPSEETV